MYQHDLFAWPPPQKVTATPEHRVTANKNLTEKNNTPAALSPQATRARINPRTKAAAVLKTFLEDGERGMNCFESVRIAHDFTLRSTISNLRIQYGLVFARRWEEVPGHGGNFVECCRYWLARESIARARELLSQPEARHVVGAPSQE